MDDESWHCGMAPWMRMKSKGAMKGLETKTDRLWVDKTDKADSA